MEPIPELFNLKVETPVEVNFWEKLSPESLKNVFRGPVLSSILTHPELILKDHWGLDANRQAIEESNAEVFNPAPGDQPSCRVQLHP